MEYEEVIQRIGRDDVTATFGCAPPEEFADPQGVSAQSDSTTWSPEIVGPLKPEGVYYGQAFGYDEDIEEFVLHHPIPLITFTFNKYRPDLPPWEQVHEFVLASEDDGAVVEATFIDPSLRGVNTTGPLKTVELQAEGPVEGVEGAIVTRDAVAEKRGMTRGNVRDGSEFRVDGVLD